MREILRRATRAVVGRAWSLACRAERFFRVATVATLTDSERDALRVREWEHFATTPLDAEGLFEWEEAWFRRHLPPSARILLVGAGTGRDVFPLVAFGHRVVALDVAPGALGALRARAAERGLDVPIIEAPIERADLEHRAFDAAIFSWFCYGYVRSREARVEALRRVASAVRADGRILLTYQAGAGSTGARLAGAIRPLARALGTTPPEPQDSFGVSRTGAVLSVSHSRLFTIGDVESEAMVAGLDVVSHDRVKGAIGRLVLTTHG